jgi:hypothetical protein
MITSTSDVIQTLFEYLNSTSNSLKDKNIYIMLFLNEYIKRHDIELLNKFLYDSRIKELKPSLLKSILIMIENVSELNNTQGEITKIYNDNIRKN